MNTCDELRSIIAQSYQAMPLLRLSKCGKRWKVTYTSGGQLGRGLCVSANRKYESTVARGLCGGYRLEFSSEGFDGLFSVGFTRGRPFTDFQNEGPVF